MGEARERKINKYADLVEEYTANGWMAELWTEGIGCRGFAGF